MLNKIFYALAVCLLFSVNLLATATLPTPNVTPVHNLNRIIAVINDEIITQSEFDHALVVSRQQVIHNGMKMPDEKTFRNAVLDQLIYQKLQLQLAKRNNITATDTEVNDAIDRIIAQNHITLAILKQKLQEEGVAFDVFKTNIRQQIIIGKLQRQAIGNSITVSKAEVAEFRAKHPAQVGPIQYDLATILIPLPESPTEAQVAQAKATATAVYNEVRTQQNFDAVMAKYPGSSDLGYRALSDLPQIFAVQVVKMHSGEIAGPIQAPNGFHVIKLLDAQQKGGNNLTDQQVQIIIYQQKMDKLLEPWLQKLKKSAYIKIYTQ
jgi:peptidyl-prolyl cis-trans isomerase SurA